MKYDLNEMTGFNWFRRRVVDDVEALEPLRHALAVAGEQGWSEDRLVDLAPLVKSGRWKLDQIGVVTWISSDPEPGSSCLHWMNPCGNGMHLIPLHLMVTIVDGAGAILLRRRVRDFTIEELLQYTPFCFWIFEENPFSQQRSFEVALKLGDALEKKQKESRWLERFEDAERVFLEAHHPEIGFPVCPQVQRSEAFGEKGTWLSISVRQPIADDLDVRIYSVDGKLLAKKRFADLNF